jgi:ABC-type transport system substrate-binding protein
MMGTGAFKLAEWIPGIKYVFVRNDNYWREGLPYLDTVELIPIVEGDVRTNALITGEVDLIEFPPWKDWDRIESYPNLTITKCPSFVMTLFFNPNFKPFANPKVRQAIKYAIDDNLIVKIAFFGHATPSGAGLLLPYGEWAMPEEYKNYFYYDPDKARDLLAEAGYPNGFKVKLDVSGPDIMHLNTAQIVQDQLAKVGIDVQLELIEWGGVVEKRVKGTYDFMVYAWMLTAPDPGNYSLYLDSSSGVYSKPIGYKDEIMDKLLELGILATDFKMRKKVYELVEMRYLEQYPFATLARREDGYAHSTKVKGFIAFPYGIQSPCLPVDGVWIEK